MGFLTTSPTWVAALLLVGVITSIGDDRADPGAAAWALEELRTNNEVAGFKFATVACSMRCCLRSPSSWCGRSSPRPTTNVAAEAGAAATIYRPGGRPRRRARGPAALDAITRYLRCAVEADWPAMARGGQPGASPRTLDAVYATLLRFEPRTAAGRW